MPEPCPGCGSIGSHDPFCPLREPCAVCGEPRRHKPDCTRPDVVAVRAEAEQRLQGIVDRQTGGTACEELTGLTPEGILLRDRMVNDPEFVRQTEEGWQAIEEGRCSSLAEVKKRLALEDELKEARRLRADDIALLARIHLTLARALGCGVHDRGPEECATRLVADRDRLEKVVEDRDQELRRVTRQLNTLLLAARALEDAHHHDRSGMMPLAQNSDRTVRAIYEFLETLRTVTVAYDPQFGDDKVCICGHEYRRHFDTYDGMAPVGCKYCGCHPFRLKP